MRMLFTRPLNIFRSRSEITEDRKERDIEDRIVNAPHRFFDPELRLVVRQPFIKLNSSWWNPRVSPRVVKPDLLGVDAKGRLVIIEIKATRATAAAVSQGEKYRKVLDKKSIPEIVGLVEQYSGIGGIKWIFDFASWYRVRFGPRKLDTLRRFRVMIVSPGIDCTAKQRLKKLRKKEIDIRHVDIDGIKPGSPAVTTSVRRPLLKTAGSLDKQLSQNLDYYACGDLFRLVRNDIDRCVSRCQARNKPTGIRWSPPAPSPAPPAIGVDVFRGGYGAVGVLVFKRCVSAARRDIDLLREHLVCVGDTYYKADKTVDTVLVVHSPEEWRSHRVRFLRIARKINASAGIGRLRRLWNRIAQRPKRAPAKRRVRQSGKKRPRDRA